MADPFTLGGFIPDTDRWGQKVCQIQQGSGNVNLTWRKEDTDAILSKVSQCPYTGIWRAPWVYAYFDTRIVRRSNMMLANLENKPYGLFLNFQEFMYLPPQAILQAAAIKEAGGELKPTTGPSVGGEKEMLQQQGKYYEQGEGPPLEELADAWVAFFLYAQTASGKSKQC